jgi:hypothetical protein
VEDLKQQIWQLFDQSKGIDSQVIDVLFALRSAMDEGGSITDVFDRFVALDHQLEAIRDLVKPDVLKEPNPFEEFFRARGV